MFKCDWQFWSNFYTKNNGKASSRYIVYYHGNVKSKFASIGGKLKGNVNSDRINIKKTANVEGVMNQKTLAIQEGAQLKIKTETHK